jgi:hypothetical protein
MPALTRAVERLLREALRRAGLAAEEWHFAQSTGDGYDIGLRPEVAPLVLDPFLGRMEEVLAEGAERLPRRVGPVRMRASVQLGHLPDEGSSTPLVQAHRLLDSEPLREALARTDPEVTHLAAILAPRVFSDVVAAGYSTLRPGELTPVPVRVKEFATQRAYLYIPRPSGHWLGAGPGGAGRRPPAAGAAGARRTPGIEIAAAAQRYVPPPAALQARQQLHEQRVVVLAGDPGARRSTALWLLAELARADGVCVVDIVKRWTRPAVSGLPLDARLGAVLDLNDPATDAAASAFAEDLRPHAARLRERGSYLVITVRPDLWRRAWWTLPAVELGRPGVPPPQPSVHLTRLPPLTPPAASGASAPVLPVPAGVAAADLEPAVESLRLTGPDGQESAFALRDDLGGPRAVVTLGRAAPGTAPPDIVLDAAPTGSWISRVHCRLEHDNGRWFLVPCGDNRPLLRRRGAGAGEAEPVASRVRLRDGDTIHIPNAPTPDGPRRWSIRFDDPQDTRTAAGRA